MIDLVITNDKYLANPRYNYQHRIKRRSSTQYTIKKKTPKNWFSERTVQSSNNDIEIPEQLIHVIQVAINKFIPEIIELRIMLIFHP